MKGSITRYCTCRDSNTRKLYGPGCPRLRTDGKHGEWCLRVRLSSSSGYREMFRRGFAAKKAAEAYRDQVHALLALARGVW